MGLKRVVGVEVDVEEIVSGGAINRDFVLKDYDIVYVPKTRVQSVTDFSQQFMQIIDPPLGLATRAWQFINLSAAFEYYRNTAR